MAQWREIGSRAAARARDVANLLTTPLLPDDLLGTLNPVWSTTEPAGRVVAVRRETADTSTLLHPHRPAPAAAPARPVRRRRRPARRRVALAHVLGDVAAGRPAARRHRHRDPGRDGVGRARPRDARSGTVLRLGPPAGEFVLPEPVPEKLLFVTAGSGVTPVMGMLRHLAAAPAGGARRRRRGALRPDRGRRRLRRGAARARRRDRAAAGRAAHRARRPAHPGRARLPRARLGRAADLGVRARPACSTTWATGGPATATRTRCTSSGSSPRARPAAAGTGGRVRFPASKVETEAAPGQPLMARRRGGRRAAAQRLPHGHLPHLRRAPALGRRDQPAHRRAPRHPRGTGPDVRVGRGRRRRNRALGDSDAVATLTADHLTDEQIEALGRRARRPPRRGHGRPRRARRPLHPQGHQDAARPGASTARGLLLFAMFPPAWIAGHGGAVGGQDPGEHGARPQRHARPVGLDARPEDPLHDVGVGPRVARPRAGRSRTTSSTTRTRTSSARTATSATRSCASRADQPWKPVHLAQPLYNQLLGAVLRVGRRALRPRGRPGQGRHASPRRRSRPTPMRLWRKARRQLAKDYVL